jgi:hypothetical protein
MSKDFKAKCILFFLAKFGPVDRFESRKFARELLFVVAQIMKRHHGCFFLAVIHVEVDVIEHPGCFRSRWIPYLIVTTNTVSAS